MTVNEEPVAPVHTIDCSSGSADVTVTSPTGAGFEYSIDGGSYQSGTTFNGVNNGNHVISVRNAAGCTATGGSFQVNCGCANAPSLNLSATSRSICGTAPVTVSGNTFSNATQVTITEDGAGSVNASTAGSSPFSFTYTPAAGDAGNTVIITVTTDNPSGAPCEAAVATYSLTVNEEPVAPVAGTITQPSCTENTGSVILTGLPATGTWTIEPGTITGTGNSRTITGLNPGTYNFTVTNAAGCISEASDNIVINDQPETPSAPVHTIDCTTGSADVTVTSPLGTGFEYSIDGGSYQSGVTFNSVVNGSHVISVINAAGCTATGG